MFAPFSTGFAFYKKLQLVWSFNVVKNITWLVFLELYDRLREREKLREIWFQTFLRMKYKPLICMSLWYHLIELIKKSYLSIVDILLVINIKLINLTVLLGTPFNLLIIPLPENIEGKNKKLDIFPNSPAICFITVNTGY